MTPAAPPSTSNQGFQHQPRQFQQQSGGYQPPQQQAAAPAPAAAPEPVNLPKAPIPQQHQIIQDVFDSLRTKCVTAANHPVCQRRRNLILPFFVRKKNVLIRSFSPALANPSEIGRCREEAGDSLRPTERRIGKKNELSFWRSFLN